MEHIGIAETIEALRGELSEAMLLGEDQDIQFPVGGVQLEFHVGITKSAEGKGGVRFWVVELGGGGSYGTESIQKVTVNLQPPVGGDGTPIKVTRSLHSKP